MTIAIPYKDDFTDQMERTRAHGDYPCIVCGRKVRDPRYMVHVHGGGLTIATEQEAEELNKDEEGAADMGMYPIGADCLRKHPELKPYVQEQEPIKMNWRELYYDLYRQTHGEDTDEGDILADAIRRAKVLSYHK